ncbi:restriction endonuclease subunit S [Enterococcus casseliflavus]|uniref:restriction endonuclease subunit S n=1 Tax=Enterococcus casseliflavus TaxID=37734 RepID=UPI001AD72B58|nr:restriction endonuclease subunit S [Enterococcus casseliflavus]MBO6387166.1 restriction endonuclease subunit S [Enterococcus casseliflavus]
MSNDTQPEIRFPGFTDDWEERKLKDIFDIHTDFVSNGSFQALKDNVKLYKTENYAYMIRLQDASNNWSGPWLYTDKQGFDFLSKSMVYKDDILMSDRGTIGKFFLVPQLDKPMTLSSNAVLLRSTKNDNNFIYYMLNTSNISNQIIVRTTPGVQSMISKTEFKKINTRIPNIQEQQKIGSFFKQLDNTIALHQRKLDLLKETKKGFLQKMFPKNGAKVPEIRFPGFTEDWEQRKVFEISKVTYGGGTPKTNTKEFWNGNIPWIQSSDLEINRLFNVSPKKKITNEAVKKSAAKIIPPNSIAIVTRVGVGKLALMPFEYATSQDFLSLSELQIDSYFGIFSLYSMLQKELKNIQGTSIKGMTKSDLLEKKVTIPKKYEEQQKIGNFFKQLDDIITLHQRKLDLLKETKKGFLQKMFV